MSITALPAPRDHTVAESSSEGAGVVSSWVDLGKAVDARDADEIAWTAAGAALDTLGTAMDPLGGLAGAGVGWLIEHVWFLHEPLDALAGDPIRIKDEAGTWEAVATRLTEIAALQVDALDGVADWEGAAAESYREATHAFAFGLDRAADLADVAASEILASGADVAIIRALIRDQIAGFVGDVVAGALAAGVTAVVTGGGSFAAFVLWTVRGAVETAAGHARAVSALLGRLDAAAARLGGTAGRFEELSRSLAGEADRLARLRPPDPTGGAELVDTVSRGAAPVVEVGKTHASGEWRPARPQA